jgi:Domain of unknown function (DU1801)
MTPSAHSAEEQLTSLISRFKPEVASLAHSILATMRERYPTAVELVYDNYNALAIGFGATERPSQAIFSVAVFPKWVSLFFLHAQDLPDPEKLLQGDGKVARHIRLLSPARLDELSVKKLMQEATAGAAIPFAPKGVPRIIIKSISAKQRPRRPEMDRNAPPAGGNRARKKK